MKRLVWWWVLLLAHQTEAADEDRSVYQRQRSLKKNRSHGDYYFGSQPDPIILRVDEGPGSRASSEKTGDYDDDSKVESSSRRKDPNYDHVNATMVMKKLKGGSPTGGYNAEKGGENDNYEDHTGKPEKEERSPAKSPSPQPKGSTKTSSDISMDKRQKKKDKHEGAADGGSSSKNTSKLEEESKSTSKSSKSKGEKGEKNNDSESNDDDDDNVGSGSSGKCISNAASAIADALPQVTTLNPESCCEQKAGVAAYLTHATLDSNTESGLSRFWQEAYDNISKVSAAHGICFVFVAASTTDTTELEQIMYDMTPDVVTMMVTDPTSTGSLMELVRSISNDATLPAIAVFNAGYSNVIVDSIVTGERRLPFIGSIDEADYGTSAATMTKELLDGATPVPMCFQANEDPQRCYAYYVDLAVPNSPPFPCNATSDRIQYDIPSSVNAIFAPAACCAAVIAAARDDIVIGCQDHDVVDGLSFVTQQPVALQAATAATWSNYAVQFGMAGAQSFPGLQTLVVTDVYSILAS